MKKYIDAEGVMRACYDSFLKTGNKAYREIFALVEAVPAEDVQEVRHGRWEHYEHREPQYDIMGVKTWAEAYKCSNCGFIHSVIEDFGHYAYCPNCGSIMDKEENE